MNMSEMGELRAINRLVGSVAKRDLHLLKAIDQTIDSLCEDKEEMDLHTQTALHFIERIKEVNSPIDPDNEIVPSLEKTRDILERVHAELVHKCEIARHAPELDSEDGVVEAYCEMIDSVVALHNAFNALAWAVGEHDADFDEPMSGGPYSNAEDLFAAMGI